MRMRAAWGMGAVVVLAWAAATLLVAQEASQQGVLDLAVSRRLPSAIFLKEPPKGADTLVSPMLVPARAVGPTPEPNSRTILAWHESAAPGLPTFAVGDLVRLFGSEVPERPVMGDVVARRHFMYRPVTADPREPWRYAWSYLVRVSGDDRNPSSRYGNWLEGAVVAGVPRR